jgi:hypothetical protein
MRTSARLFLVAALAGTLTLALVSGTGAQTDNPNLLTISIPIDTEFHGTDPGNEPDTVHLVESIPVPPDLQGQQCNARLTSINNESEREGSDLILSSGTSAIELLNVEANAGESLTETGLLTLGTTLDLSVRLGPTGDFSGGGGAGFVLCPGPPTTTTTTTTTQPPPDVGGVVVTPAAATPRVVSPRFTG